MDPMPVAPVRFSRRVTQPIAIGTLRPGAPAHRRIGRRGALSTMGRPSHRGIHMPVASTLPRRACLALLLAFSCGTVSAASPAPAAAEAAAVPPQLQDLDAYVERVREQFDVPGIARSEEHTSELQSLMRSSYAVLC